MNDTAERPSVAPVGAARKNDRPPPDAAAVTPTAPVSQNNMCWVAATSLAGAEMVLP